LVACTVTLVLVLAACGQKGPLFLPAQAGPAATPATRPSSAAENDRPPAPPSQGASSPGLPPAAK
jgi:predicted small lipoprotein YifL